MNQARLLKLYELLGGRENLENILIDFYHRMSQDIMVGYFFTNRDTKAIALKQAQFILRAMGILKPEEVQVKNPAQAHLELPKIRAGHFDRRIEILKETLADFKVDQQATDMWIEFEQSFRNVVVS